MFRWVVGWSGTAAGPSRGPLRDSRPTPSPTLRPTATGQRDEPLLLPLLEVVTPERLRQASVPESAVRPLVERPEPLPEVRELVLVHPTHERRCERFVHASQVDEVVRLERVTPRERLDHVPEDQDGEAAVRAGYVLVTKRHGREMVRTNMV